MSSRVDQSGLDSADHVSYLSIVAFPKWTRREVLPRCCVTIRLECGEDIAQMNINVKSFSTRFGKTRRGHAAARHGWTSGNLLLRMTTILECEACEAVLVDLDINAPSIIRTLFAMRRGHAAAAHGWTGHKLHISRN